MYSAEYMYCIDSLVLEIFKYVIIYNRSFCVLTPTSSWNCQVQALVPTGPQDDKSPPKKRKKEGFGPWADTKITWFLFSILFPGPRSQVPSPKSQVPSPKSQVPSSRWSTWGRVLLGIGTSSCHDPISIHVTDTRPSCCDCYTRSETQTVETSGCLYKFLLRHRNHIHMRDVPQFQRVHMLCRWRPL